MAVNFHYMGPEGLYPHGAIYPTTSEQLENQIKLLSGACRFISGSELSGAVRDNTLLPDHSCLITFDDGLRCQFETALPILDSMGIPAMFFASAKPILEGRALAVHKIHHVRAHLSGAEIRIALARYLDVSEIEMSRVLESERVAAIACYLYDDPEAAMLKWLLNFRMPPADRDRFMVELFDRLVSDERAWCEAMYMSEQELSVLARRGMLANHTYDHLPLSTLADDQVEWQIRYNREMLGKICGESPLPLISYPYGSKEAVSRSVAEVAAKLGIMAGVTTEKAVNLTLADPLLLARIGFNEAPGGKRNLVTIQDGRISISPPMTLGRTRYIREAS